MSFNVRVFGYSGIIQVGQPNADQYSGGAVFLNEEPCLWSQILVCDGSTVATSARITTIPDGTQMVCVEVPDGHEIRYEVVQPGVAARAVSSSSRRGSGSFNLAWSAGYTLSILGAATDVVAAAATATWDAATAALVALTNGNLTATNTANSGAQGARATLSRTTGKFYFEIACTSVTATGILTCNWGIGLFSSYDNFSNSHSGGAGGDQLGVLSANGGGTIYGLNLASGLHNADVIAIAVDLDTRGLWTRLVAGPDFPNPGGWNGDNSAPASDPVTEAKPITVPAGAMTPMLAFNDDVLTQSATFNFGGSAFTGALPAGYAAWSATATLDPATAFHVALSGGNLTATNNALLAPVGGVKVATASGKTSGKYYFEITMVTERDGGSTLGIGIPSATYADLRDTGTGGVRVNSSGGIYADGVYQGGIATINGFDAGDTIGFAVDLDNRSIWMKNVDGPNAPTDWNDDPGFNPATNIGGVTILAGTIVPFLTFGGNPPADVADNVFTANFGGSAFLGTVPSGFTSGWPA